MSLGEPKRILVIDDEPNLLAMMSETLQLLGFQTLMAPDGETGVALTVEKRPDAILCDVNMPGMDGFETLKIIRQSEFTASIPFILLSGYVDQTTRRKADGFGANGLITKPFSISELLGTLNLTFAKAA